MLLKNQIKVLKIKIKLYLSSAFAAVILFISSTYFSSKFERFSSLLAEVKDLFSWGRTLADQTILKIKKTKVKKFLNLNFSLF